MPLVPAVKATRIPGDPLPRSSHSLNVINDAVYIYGGEVNPREPVDGHVHRIDLKTGQYDQIEGQGDVPDPRVGHTAVTIGGCFYVFGGRGGKEMKPLQESGAVYRFDPSSSTWTRLSPSPDHPFPAARSYHCATASSTHLIIHAGCGDASTGRLRDVWAFDIGSTLWTQLADAPGDPRGGTAITYRDGKVYRMGGFNGKTELGGGIDVFTFPPSLNQPDAPGSDIKGSWETILYPSERGLSRDASDASTTLAQPGTTQSSGPGARSVTALLPFGEGRLIAIMGEGKPSPTGGHDSAGNFWGDVWVYSIEEKTWAEVQCYGPEARGWFAADSVDGGEGVVLWGGLNGANERLGDGWVLAF